ncbi:hypothetical protein BDZ97DRAFT_1755029 [Flammula alnicola]|nr:hypothetical protein BDZ97DRAFT_1755029 [Flammula alnicola]
MPYNRWTLENPIQGSAFHELVVLPTVAPHLARPYIVPGTAATNAEGPEVAAQALPPADTTPAAADALADVNPDDLLNSREFFILVTFEWTERVKSVRSSRPKKTSESKNTPDAIKVLSLTRAQFVTAALTAHGHQSAYIPGATSGPGMQISWSGFAGGKARAPVIQDDADWHMMQVQLRQQVRSTKGKLNTICVTFDLDTMEGFKNRRQLMPSHNDADLQTELIQGTRVPSMDSFSTDQVALGQAIDDIKAAWGCQKHGGACFITKDASHIELNRFRLGAFGAAVVAGQCLATGPPPTELLQAWIGPVGAAAPAKVPRGRSGPGHASSDGPSGSSDTANLLLSTIVPMVTMMAQNVTSNMQMSSRRRRSPPSSLPPSTPPRGSSPPPAIADELDKFLHSFGLAKGLSIDMVSDVSEKLKAAHYTPDAISEISLPIERLQELTGLPEGQVYSLRKFSLLHISAI